MPGNEVGDRVHNFFEQSSLSQDQHHNQVVEGNWPVLNNNQWSGNERQIAGPLNSTFKDYNVQQSDVERGQGNQFSIGSHGANFQPSNMRSEFVKNPTQLQELKFGGFMQSSQVVHSRQNEANFLGVEVEPDQHNLTSRSLSILESQQRSGLNHANSASLGGSESPMNFNFLGGQQQMSGQQPGMMQSFPRQQSAVSDAQIMQQQVILKQMQEMQRQRQHQEQFEAMQRNPMSQMSNFPNQMGGQHFPTVNGNNIMHNASNYQWQSQAMAGNTNWPHHGVSAVQGYSNGLMTTPEQGQALRFTSLMPQQSFQSLYGDPVSNSRSPNPLSHNATDKPGLPQHSAPASSFSGLQYASLQEKVDMQDGSIVSRSGSEGKTTFKHASSQGFLNVANPRISNLIEQRDEPISGGREVSDCGSELLKSQTPATSSQAAAGLDPTEEKILFGNDESIWEAFGGPSLVGTEGASRLDGPDLFNGLPSVQSGTWSALMQSAVAETSSGDVGVQEECSGLDSQNFRPQSGNQYLSALHDNEKQPIWVDSSQRASFSPRTSTNNVKTTSYASTIGLPQLSPKQVTEALHAQVQIPQDGMRWLDHRQPKRCDEQNRALENSTSKADTVFWNSQQKSYLRDNSGHPSRSTMNSIESMPANVGAASFNQGEFHDRLQNQHTSMDAGHVSAMKFESVPTFSAKIGSPHTDSMEAVSRNLSNRKGNTESMELWKSVNSSVKSGNSDFGSDQYNLSKEPPVLESSVVISGGGAARMHERENGDRRDNSSDSHWSSVLHHAQARGLRENLRADAGYNLPVRNDKLSDQAGKKMHVTKKFQYHPMGDLDMDLDSSYASKQVLNPQRTSQHLSSGVEGQETQTRFFDQLSSSSTDMEGRLSDVHGTVKMSHGAAISGIHPGYFPNTSAPFVRSSEISSSNQHGTPSQNMLELLHKVDQSMEQNMGSTGPDGPSQSQSSTSHGCSLQLAPPSQRAAPSYVQFASQISSRPIDAPCLNQMTYGKGDKAHAWLTAVSPASSGYIVADQSSAQSFDSHAHHDLQTSDSLDQALASQPVGNSPNIVPSCRYMNQPAIGAFIHPDVMHGISREDNTSPLGANQWNQQQLWSPQDHSASDLRNSQFPLNGTLEAGSLTQDKKNEQDGSRVSYQGIVGRNEPQAKETMSIGKSASETLEESTMKYPSDVSPSNSVASQKDYEESHQSLNSKSAIHHSYSLMHKKQATKSRGSDPTQRESKRLKGPDFGPETPAAQPLSDGVNNMVSEASISQTSISSGDAREPNISPQSAHINDSFQFQHGSVASYNTPLGHNDAQMFTAGNGVNRATRADISPQMAPSWFEHYGTFKNGQLLTAHSVPRVPVAKNVEPLISGKVPHNSVIQSTVQQANAVAHTGFIGNTCQTLSSYTPTEHDSDGLVSHVSMPSLPSLRPKKRKTATFGLVPWNKEVAEGFKTLQNMSSAEIDWARASNRLAEKIERETVSSEDLLPMARPKRRLILTTQLMQQVFHPPPAAIFSLNASSNYEIIVFSLARLALGDVCSLICCTEGDLPVHHDSGNIRSGEVNTSERIRDQYFAKLIEDLSYRSKELQSDLVRLDKSASVLDLRLDCQDMERFSIINRFAKFHGRAQADGTETTSSSSDTHRPSLSYLQRYVLAHPMPTTIPTNVQCLSL